MSTLNYTDIVNIINGGGVVFLDCGGVPKLIDSIPDIPPDLTICGFVERNLSEYVIVGSPANGQVPSYNSSTSKLQWTTPSSGGGTWGTITGTLSSQTDLQTALNLKASINTTDGIIPYKSGSGTLADSPITRIDASTIQVAAINGGSGANDDITIQGTSNATRTTSYVNLQPNGGNVGIGTSTPTTKLSVVGAMDLSSTTPNFRHFYNVLQADLNTLTGTLVLTAPVGRTSTMLHIVIRGFNYFGGGAWEVILGGYNHSSGWLSTSAIIQGSAPFSSVRFGYDGTKDVILLGTTTTAWSSHNKIEITDIVATVNNTTVWGTGWSAAIVASEAAYSSIVGSDTVQRPTFITQSSLPTSIPATNSGTAELLTIGASNIGVQLGAVNLSGNYYGYIRGGNFNAANLAYPLLISPNGQRVSVGHANAAGAQLDIRTPDSITAGQVIRLASSQTANALQIENSSGVQLASIAGTSMTSGSMDGRIILYNNNDAGNSGAGLEVWHYRPAVSGMAPSGKLGFRRFASGSDHGEFAVFLGVNGSMSSVPSMTLDVNGKLNAATIEATSSIRAGSANPVGFSYGGSGNLRHGMWAVDHLDMFVRVSNTEVATFSWEGHLGVGFSDRTGINARLHVKPTNASTIGAIVQGASAQTANLMEWRNSAGTVLSYVKANGSLVATAAVAGQGLELVSTVSGNTGSLTISPKSTAVGSPPDFEIANTGRLFISSYATLLTGAGGVSITGPLSGSNATFTGLTINTNDLSLLSGSNTVDKFLRLGGGKTAFILEKVGSWLRDDFHIALDDAADLNPADLTNVKLTIKNLTGNVGIGTTAPDAQLTINSQDVARPSLKIRALAGTASNQSVFESYNAAGTKTFEILDNGNVNLTQNNAILSFTGGTGEIVNGGSLFIRTSGTYHTEVRYTGFQVQSTNFIGWTSGAVNASSADVTLYRDAADTLALRRTTNAQTFRLYNTYTDASNYERLSIGWTSNIAFISTSAAGTGGVRTLQLSSGQQVNIDSDGTINLRTTSGTVRWQVSSSGHLLAGTDNTYDIGAVGTTRPRNIYVAGTTTSGTGFTTDSTGYLQFTSRGYFSASADGVFLLRNSAATDFNRLQFGGTSSSFPSIKRNGTDIDIRLADDTGYAGLTASKLVTSAANSNTTPVVQVNSTSSGLGTGTNGDLVLFSAGFITSSSNSSSVVSCVNGLAFATSYGATVRGGFTMPANSVIGLRASNGGSAPSTTVGATLHAIPDSPTQLTADQDNYQAGTGRSMFYRLSSDASRSITGFNPAGGTNQDGELHYFINVGSNNIVLVNESASSTAGNRFLNVTGADITLAANEMAMLIYDNTSARWRVAKM